MLPDQENNQQNQEQMDQYRRFQQTERAPYVEIAASGTPEQVRLVSRDLLSVVERRSVFEQERPNTYPVDITLQELEARVNAVRFWYAMWPTQSVASVDRNGQLHESQVPRAGYIENPAEREQTAQSFERTRDEIIARRALTLKHNEQQVFSGDVGLYTKDYFLRTGKDILPSHHYGVILNSEPTIEGFAPYGQKVEEAVKALIDIGEGRAYVRAPNGQRKKLPNIHSMPANRGLWEAAYKIYVSPGLRNLRDENRPNFDNLVKAQYEEVDDFNAFLTAVELFQHLDLDVKYSLGRSGSRTGDTLSDFISPAELTEISMETGMFGKDSAKMNIEVRRATEWGIGRGDGHREHPRPAGNPMNLGCFPNMGGVSALDIMKTDLPLTPEQKRQIGANSPNKITMPVSDAAFGNERGNRIKVRVGAQEKEIIYEPVGLAGIPWDDAKIVNLDGNEELLEFAAGPQTDAFEVPYKLYAFMAYGGIYEQVMRTDYPKQWEEVIGSDLLLKMNKKIDTAIGMLAATYGIDSKTADKLNNYIRAVFVGSLAASQLSVTRAGKTIESANLVNTIAMKKNEINQKNVLNPLKEQCRMSAFLPLNEKGDDIDNNWWSLVQGIVKNRKAPKPGGCRVNGKLFSEEELRQLSPLYPLGTN